MGLITKAADIKRHNGAVDHAIVISSVQSFIDDATNNYLIPAIGRATYNDIVDAGESTDPDRYALYLLLQKSCVGFFLAEYSVSGALQITDTGISVIKGTNFAPASDKKLMALRKKSFENGYASLEKVIIYLEEFPVLFPNYQLSTERKNNRQLLINTSAEFQAAGVNIGNSAQLYQTLKTYQDDAERTYINPLLGDNLNALIRGVILSGVASDIQQQLIKEIQRPVANFTLMEAIPYMAVSLDASGIYQLSETVGGISGNVENRTTAETSRLQTAMYNLQRKGERQLETLRKWIERNKASFTEYTVPTAILMNDDPNSNTYFL